MRSSEMILPSHLEIGIVEILMKGDVNIIMDWVDGWMMDGANKYPI